MSVLKNVSRYRNELIFVAVLLLFVVLSIENMIFLIGLGGYLIYLGKVNPQIAKLGLVVCLLFVIRLGLIQHPQIDTTKTQKVIITSVREYDQYMTFQGTMQSNNYHFSYKGNHVFSVGEQYLMRIEQTIDNSGDIPYTFDIDQYDKAKNIKGRYAVLEYTLVKKTFHINQVIAFVDDYIKDSSPKSYGYIKTMVLADNEAIDEDVLEAINMLGISHLFAVSGLHIGLLVLILKKGLTIVFKNAYIQDGILVIFLSIYMVLTSFSPSVVRTSMMVMFLLLNQHFKLSLDTLDIVSLVFIILLFVHPYFYLQLGFQLSFLMTFFIILGRPLLSFENKIQSAFALSVLAFFATLPFVVSLNQSINFLTVFFNVFYLFIVMFVMLPAAYITFVCPMFDQLYDAFIKLFEKSVLLCSTFDVFTINFVMNKLIYIIIYYVLFIGILIQLETKRNSHKWGKIAIGFMIFLHFQGKCVLYDRVHFVNVYGDATVIQSAHDRCNILIDTGVNDPYDELIIYLKNQHIKRLDYVIVSHHHADHNGEIEDVFKEFDVINYIDQYNVEQYQDITVCGNNQFFFYPMKRGHHNENDNSLVMSMFVGSDHYLFTGDIEQNIEQLFIETFKVEDVDKLKVPHHGSITSSTDEFIDFVSPKEAYVLVALKNTHNHPSEVVMQRYLLRGIEVYRTDELGTIEIRYLFGKEWKKISKK